MEMSSSDSNVTKWMRIQNELKTELITENDDLTASSISKVGGLDISFRCNETDKDTACVSLIVLDVQTLEVLYEDSSFVTMDQEYQTGFLGFREVEFFKEKLVTLKKRQFQTYPEVVLVDGNGILHFNGFGSASHLGVVCGIPSIGVAKNLSLIESLGIFRDEEHKQKIKAMNRKGDRFPIITSSNETVGMAVLTGEKATNPVYVSIGHNCCLNSAVDIVLKCSKHRVPEPIRQADTRSRAHLRKKFPEDYPSSSNTTRGHNDSSS